MSEWADIVEQGRRELSRDVSPPQPTDYAELNRIVRKHKAALTRAENSGDARKVIVAVNRAVDAFDAPGMIWPDDWTDWERALDDVITALRGQSHWLAERYPNGRGAETLIAAEGVLARFP